MTLNATASDMANMTVTTPAQEAKRNDSSHCVIFRTGGTANFEWHRSFGMVKFAAEALAEETRKMGYESMVANYAQSLAIGLPETFDANTSIN